MRFLLLLHCVLLIAVAHGQQSDLPNPPLGQVLDRQEWLGTERERALETRLRRYRAEFGVDILVVVWNRELKEDQTLATLARSLGESWSREEFWALVLAHPDSVQRPVVAYGGAVADRIDSGSLDFAVQEAIARGLKDWTAQARVESLAMEVGEEFTYLQQRRLKEFETVRERMAEISEGYQVGQKKRALKFTLLCAAIALALFGTIAFWIKRRRKGPYTFPETHWRKRLGGDWSGGSTIAATLPSTNSS